MEVSLKVITPEAEEMIVEIARVSSSRKDKREEPHKLINYLISNNHWSPFEHGFMTLEIVTSRAIGTQLLRHRSFFFQEFSQRYARVSAIEPIELRLQAEKNRQSSTDEVGKIYQDSYVDEEENTVEVFNYETYIDDFDDEQNKKIVDAIARASTNVELVEASYQELIDLGVAKECARMLLPMAAQTKIYMTGNIRSWIHFIPMRVDAHAQKEAQLIGIRCRDIFQEHLPNIAKALNW